MKCDNSNRFLRRPRPSKLEQIKLEVSSCDEESSDDSDSVNSFDELSGAIGEDSNAFNTHRELASYASFIKPNPLPKLLKETILLPPLNTTNPTPNEKITKEDYKFIELFGREASSIKKSVISKKRPNNVISPLKSVVSQSQLSHRARSEKEINRQHSFVDPIKLLPGPDPMPCRPLKFHHDDIDVKKTYYDTYSYDNTEIQPRYDEFSFNFNDFLYDDSKEPTYEKIQVDKNFKLISNRNYNKICKLLEEKINEIDEEEERDHKQMHIQTLVPEIKPFENRKPKRQIELELASFLKNDMGKEPGTAKSKSRYLDETSSVRSSKKGKKNQDDEEEVTPTQLAIVDCLLRNGISLSLKAHFLDAMPNLDSLKKTLIYLNVSYNNLTEIPEEILNIYQLQVLKMKNNPLKHVTDKLSNLQNLMFLNLSYCQLNEVPLCIFELENLIHLDVSYNRIPNIDVDIIKLRKLKTLNYEGNEIEYLPGCMLKMKRLKNINVKKNYLHPLIWRKLVVNQIPSLFAISAARVEEVFGEDSNELLNLDHKYRFSNSDVQDKMREILTRCDCCSGKRYDEGLRIIRPCLKAFGVKYLPFLFNSCSPKCFNLFKTNSNC